jgi:hypothetical protein
VVDAEHIHGAGRLVNAVDHAVGSTPCAVAARERAEKRLADPARTQCQRTITEFENGRGYRLRQALGGAARGGLIRSGS